MGQSTQELQLNSRSETWRPKSAVWPDWSRSTVVCIATGGSLTAEQVEFIKGHKDQVHTIAVNGAGLSEYLPLSAPWADILYAADRLWWLHYNPEFEGMKVSGEPVEGVDTIPLKMLERGELMPREPGAVVSAGHSGFQALGLALSLGAARVILLGYDCKAGRAHDRPDKFNRDSPYDQWAKAYNQVPAQWPGVEIFNCTPGSAITAFEFVSMDGVL
jgi:hypothetical protein